MHRPSCDDRLSAQSDEDQKCCQCVNPDTGVPCFVESKIVFPGTSCAKTCSDRGQVLSPDGKVRSTLLPLGSLRKCNPCVRPPGDPVMCEREDDGRLSGRRVREAAQAAGEEHEVLCLRIGHREGPSLQRGHQCEEDHPRSSIRHELQGHLQAGGRKDDRRHYTQVPALHTQPNAHEVPQGVQDFGHTYNV